MIQLPSKRLERMLRCLGNQFVLFLITQFDLFSLCNIYKWGLLQLFSFSPSPPSVVFALCLYNLCDSDEPYSKHRQDYKKKKASRKYISSIIWRLKMHTTTKTSSTRHKWIPEGISPAENIVEHKQYQKTQTTASTTLPAAVKYPQSQQRTWCGLSLQHFTASLFSHVCPHLKEDSWIILCNCFNGGIDWSWNQQVLTCTLVC